MTVDFTRLRVALDHVRRELLLERHPGGYWEGALASSPAATAAAVSALAVYRATDGAAGEPSDEQGGLTGFVCRGLQWLADCQNPDGGWGDTNRGPSSLPATMLVTAAFQLTGVPADHRDLMARAEEFLRSAGGIRAFHRQYGRDRTFTAPVLANCALAEIVPWGEVTLRGMTLVARRGTLCGGLPNVLGRSNHPGLMAAELGRDAHRGTSSWPLFRWLRPTLQQRLETITQLQSETGGYLESVPLTSFVVMNLAAAGQRCHPSVCRGINFLRRTARADGSWAIDANRSVCSTLVAMRGLCTGHAALEPDRIASLEWLLECQHHAVHAIASGAPGGWASTDLPGAVPSAEETSEALLALRLWYDLPGLADEKMQRVRRSARQAVRWLLAAQHRSGGWPSCGRQPGLPVEDGVGPETTGRALQALCAWPRAFDASAQALAVQRGFRYLRQTQRDDSCWTARWYGSPRQPDGTDAVYGTARVLLAFSDGGQAGDGSARQAVRWLIGRQQRDGSWGPPCGTTRRGDESTGTVEETAVAVEALLGWSEEGPAAKAIAAGVNWLARAVEHGLHRRPTPLALSWAKLWYYDGLYPLGFAASALARAAQALAPTSAHSSRHVSLSS
jgi:squalene-hopene/tetraprenyl-beta-curcumene cyclase